MMITEFEEQTTVYAEDQSEYLDLPAYHTGNKHGQIYCCWSLSLKERLVLLFTGRIWHSILTFYKPLQPQMLQVKKPAMEKNDEQ